MPALPAAGGISGNLAQKRARLVQRPGPFVWARRRPPVDCRPRSGPARREPHRPAFHRRLCRRPPLRHAQGIRLRQRRLRGASGRRPHPHRLPHHQCRAVRSAGEQADAAGDRHLPRLSPRHAQGDDQYPRHRDTGTHRPRNIHYRPKIKAQRARLFARPRLSDGTVHPVRELSLLALQHLDAGADAANVPRCVCAGAARTSTRRLNAIPPLR